MNDGGVALYSGEIAQAVTYWAVNPKAQGLILFLGSGIFENIHCISRLSDLVDRVDYMSTG